MTTAVSEQPQVRLRNFAQHPKALAFIKSPAKRKIARAGRRGAKTTAVSRLAAEAFCRGLRVLYATPTADQLDAFWFEVNRALADPVAQGVLYKNETLHIIELSGTKQRIRGKTAWNADTLRGDYADLLILDEFQLMDEDTWDIVGAPMLLDNDGNAVFIYTPPSLHSKSVTKARDPRHAAKVFKAAQEDTTGLWEAFHWTSHDNPFISEAGLARITYDMTALALRQEIDAEDVDEAPGALWKRENIEAHRVRAYPSLVRVMVGMDPPGGATECGIVAVGIGGDGHFYVLEDASLQTSPESWAEMGLTVYERHKADRILGEANYGGDMVESNIRRAADALGVAVSYKNVHATRGKAVRAEPVAAAYERGEVHHVGDFSALEDELCLWIPGQSGHSPNRMDALVWACTELLGRQIKLPEVHNQWQQPRRPEDNPLGLDLNNPKYRDKDRKQNPRW